MTPDGWRYRSNAPVPEGANLPPGVERIAAALEYDGSGYCGWQRQAHCTAVQATVEAALSRVAAEPISVSCAGRTDTGVHATNQIIHFDSHAHRSPRNWVLGANANLPAGIRLHWAGPMPTRFHARFSATARTYRYLICNRPYRPALMARLTAWERGTLVIEPMIEAARYLLGEHDFSSFRGAGCQSASPCREVEYVELFRHGDTLVLEIRANGFLLHMVRNIAGALLAIGRGERAPRWIADLLALRDRTQAAATAAAAGLYLVAVRYPDEFAIPAFAPGPGLLNVELRD